MSDYSLGVRRYQSEHATVLELHGALIAATVLEFDAGLAMLVAGLHRPLVLDLTGVGNCDASGAAALTTVARAAHPDVPVRLAAPNPAVYAVLRAAGTPTQVPVFASVDGALREDPGDLFVDTPPTS